MYATISRMLSSKAYWNQFSQEPRIRHPVYPGDQFLSAALNEEPDLIDTALSQQIILATPTSLSHCLKAVASRLATACARRQRRRNSQACRRSLRAAEHFRQPSEQELANSFRQQRRQLQSRHGLTRTQMSCPAPENSSNLGIRPKKEIETDRIH